METWKMACSFPTRTRIVFPASNTFLVHPIELHGPCRSRVTLRVWAKCHYSSLQTLSLSLVYAFRLFTPQLFPYIQCCSLYFYKIYGTINAPKDPNAWAGLNPRKWLYFRGVNHLTLEGGGEINGMGYEWWMRSCKINSTNVISSSNSVSFCLISR